jgi:hypothetical protein
VDLSRTQVVLRERAVVDVLDLSLRFVMRHLGLYARTSAIVILPFFLVSYVVCRTVNPTAGWAFAVLLAPIPGAAFTVLASRLVFEDHVPAGFAVRTAARRIASVFAIELVVCLAAALGTLALVLGAFFPLTAFMFAPEALLLEGQGVSASLRRSATLASRSSSETLMTLWAILLLGLVATCVADLGGRTFMTALLESAAPASLWDAGYNVFALLGFWLFVPYATTARFFVYLDVRTRDEGWDIQTRFTALAARGAETATVTRSAA